MTTILNETQLKMLSDRDLISEYQSAERRRNQVVMTQLREELERRKLWPIQ
jgi:hypothetical protein